MHNSVTAVEYYFVSKHVTTISSFHRSISCGHSHFASTEVDPKYYCLNTNYIFNVWQNGRQQSRVSMLQCIRNDVGDSLSKSTKAGTNRTALKIETNREIEGQLTINSILVCGQSPFAIVQKTQVSSQLSSVLVLGCSLECFASVIMAGRCHMTLTQTHYILLIRLVLPRCYNTLMGIGHLFRATNVDSWAL